MTLAAIMTEADSQTFERVLQEGLLDPLPYHFALVHWPHIKRCYSEREIQLPVYESGWRA